MMVIRAEQVEVFEAIALDAFEREMVEHLKSFEPALCQAAGDAGVREAVKLGVKRAREYGFTTRGSVCFYIELMCVLGSDFDTDPQLYWAEETLKDESLEGEGRRGSWLYDRMTVYLDEVVGPENRGAIGALRRLDALDLQQQAANQSMTPETILKAMAAVYPEKAAFAGEDVLNELIEDSTSKADDYSLPSPGGTATLAGLMFALGHGICRDPFYPWISGTLNDPRTKDGAARLKRLLKKIQIYVEHALKHLDG